MNFILRMKLEYNGHIKRRHDTLERQVLEGQVSRTRLRGRPRSDWEDNVKTFGSMERAGRSADRTTFDYGRPSEWRRRDYDICRTNGIVVERNNR